MFYFEGKQYLFKDKNCSDLAYPTFNSTFYFLLERTLTVLVY